MQIQVLLCNSLVQESILTHGDSCDQVDIQDLHGCEGHVVHLEHKRPEDGATLGKVDRQVEQQDFAQVVPHTPETADK